VALTALRTELAALCARHGVTVGPSIVHMEAPELPPDGLDLRAVVEQFENTLIAQALRRVNGNKNQAARLLRLNRTTLIEKMRSKQTYSAHFRELMNGESAQ
jgi:DNA-binding NtrC family response regulator